jgi:uncharacterized protein
MSTTPAVKSISLHPTKSLGPVTVEAALVLPSGALEHDREFALFDEQGKVMNGKREQRIHGIRATYDVEKFTVALNDSRPFHLISDHREIELWMESFLGIRVLMKRNTQTGFPDDLESPGPTIVGSATLREVSGWFGITDPLETSRRFRANIELATDAPFWEDCLFGEADTVTEFHVGDVTILGVNPCQRCAVPSRDPSSGRVTPDFQRVFAEKRAESLPPWATKSRFNHYYRLAVNTQVPATETGKLIRVGDVVSLYSARSSGGSGVS